MLLLSLTVLKMLPGGGDGPTSTASKGECEVVATGQFLWSCSVPCADTARVRFESLLRARSIRPMQDVLNRLEKSHPAALMVSTSDAAMHWYEHYKALPKTKTRGFFKAKTGVTLDGDSNTHYNIIHAVDSEGAPKMFKMTPSTSIEVRASKLLLGMSNLVPCEFYECILDQQHQSHGLLMPRYAHDISQTYAQLEETILFERALAMVVAVNNVHKVDLVHMDIKQSNILVDHLGKWWLGDFGSCVKHGEVVQTTTPFFFPRDVTGEASQWHFDWYMLAIVVLSQLKVDDFKRLSKENSITETAHEVLTLCGESRPKALISHLLQHHDKLFEGICVACASPKNTKSCARCGGAVYCSRECQKRDWKVHKAACKHMGSASTGPKKK
jgi:serine/threonine protein kinase